MYYEQERDPSILKVFCGNCNRYTSHINGEKVISFDIKPVYFDHSKFTCKICDSEPTLYNVQYALELARENQGNMSAHPHFLPPLFKYGETCLLRSSNRIGYAHCKIYGMRYVDMGNSRFGWEYYIIIHGKKEFEWVKEECMHYVKHKVY